MSQTKFHYWIVLILASALGGTLTSLALPPLHFFPVLLITFGAIGIFINRCQSFFKAFCVGWIFGFFFYGSNLYWLVYAVLIRADDYWWFVPFPSIGCAIILAPLIAAATSLSLFFKAPYARLIAFAALWTLFDMARIFIFSGFTWNSLGSAAAIPGPIGDIFIQPAAWIGEDGFTLIFVFLGIFFGTMLWEKILSYRPILNIRAQIFPKNLSQISCLSAVIFLILWGFAGWLRLKSSKPLLKPNPYVVIVQGNIPEAQKEDNDDPFFILHRYQILTSQGLRTAQSLKEKTNNPLQKQQPIVFVWPETAYPATDIFFQDAPVIRRAIMDWGKGAQYGFIGALRTDQHNNLYNSLFALNRDGRIAASYDKARLVPFGEYRPHHIPIQMSKLTSLTPGDGVKTWHLTQLSPVAPLICYEMIFSGHVINPHDRPSWLANVTNDAWFGNSAGPRQHLASVRLRAVEEGLPVVRAANTGISTAYDAWGHQLNSLGWDKTGSLVLPLPPPLPRTLFSYYGQTIPIALCLLLLIIAARPHGYLLTFGRKK